jgi:hypothetical protein
LGDLVTQQVKVVIPPGMLSAGTVVTVTNPENAPPVANSIGKPISAPVKISIGDSASEDVPVRLNQLVTVTLKFDPSKLSSSTDPTTLWAAFYDAVRKQWEPFQPDQVDMKAGTMTFTMGHLTNVTAIDIPLGVYTEKVVRSKAVVDVLNEKAIPTVIDHLVEKAIDHTLKDGLGLKDDSTKSKVYSSLVKDGEWGEISAKGASILGSGKDASADDVVDLVQTVNVFVGKKMVENIPEGQLADALTKLSPDKWAKYKEGGASQGYENAVAWTKSGAEAAAYLAEKRYLDAARVIGEQIADGVPLVKAVKASAEVIDYGITVWKNAEVEAAYKAYKNGASIKSGNSTFGIGSKYEVNKGDFNEVWDQTVAVGTWIQGQAIKAEEKARTEDSSRGKLPLSEAEDKRIRAKAQADLKADFEERARREAEIEKVQADLQDLLDKAKAMDMLGGASSLRYNPDTLETRVKTILTARAMIVRDTWGLKGKKVTNQDIAELAKWFLSGRNLAEGRELYWKELKRRFGIDLAPPPTPVKPPPTATPKATPAIAATPIPTPTPKAPAGTWVQFVRRIVEIGPNIGTVSGNTATAFSWTCSWPEPPQTFLIGQEWGGTLTVRDAGSKPSDRLSARGQVGIGIRRGPFSFLAFAVATVAPVPGQSSTAQKSFSTTIPDDNNPTDALNALQISFICTSGASGGGGYRDPVAPDAVAGVEYYYQMRK